MIKAIFFDIDGTLVSFTSHRIPASAKEAICQLRAKGVKVFIASGRHWRVMNNLEGLDFDGYVTLNGTCCYAGRDLLVYKKAIPAEDVACMAAIEAGEGAFPCIVVREDGMFINYLNAETDEVFRLLNFPVPPVQPLPKL